MNILLTVRSLSHYRGTEMWTYNMAKELVRQGHKVTILTNELGRVSTEASEFATIITQYKGEYDFAICNHLDTYIKLPDDLYKIYTSHSCFLKLEQFPSTANVRVGVSEEIGGDVIIGNGIDCNKFYYSETNDELKNVLYLCSPLYQGLKEFMQNVCKDRYNLITIDRETNGVADLIHKADLVVGHGRGLIEAMACGRNVISCDYRITYMDGIYGGGIITEKNFNKLSKNNFSGRPKQKSFNIKSLRKEMKKYDKNRGKKLSELVNKYYNIEINAKKYIDLYEKGNK